MFAKICVVSAIVITLMLAAPAFGMAHGAAAASSQELDNLTVTGLSRLGRPEDAGLRIALTWDTLPGAFGYSVYRSESEDGPFTSIGGKGADSMAIYPVFLDETAQAGKGYYYAVAVVDASLNEGPLCARVYAELEAAARVAGGSKSITCSLSDQRLYFFEGDQLVNIMRCSTGRNNATPTGHFRILGHSVVNVGLGGAVCDYWMSFTSAHGMHAWPRGLRGYESGLGAPASHGCIRLHPLEAYWPYNWAPNGTPLMITYGSLARRVITGCHDSCGAPELSTSWYFAEGYTGEAYDTFLLMYNPGENAVTAQVTFLKDGGGVVEGYYGISPHCRFTLKVDDVPLMDACAFAIQVNSDGPIMVERAMYFDAGSRNDGTASVGATQLSSDWYFAEGCTAMGFDTFILMANPADNGVTAWVYFCLEGGGTVEYACWIAPRSRFTLRTDELPGVGSSAFSTRVHAEGPIVAERAMYFSKGYIDGGHSSIGATQLSREWYFAEGCTRNFFESYILVGNPGDEDALVHIDYYYPDGSLRQSFVVWAGSRLTVPIGPQPGLDQRDVAFRVTADHDVVAERAIYYGLDSRKGGSASMGSTVTSRNWYFAEGHSDGTFDTYILLCNPGDSPAMVNVNFSREDCANFAYSFGLPAQRRISLHVDDLAGLERASFATTVSSDVPIVAERAMYFVMPVGY
jgi:hypothetical protein